MSRRPGWWLTVLAIIWPITWISARMTTWPVIGKVVAFFSLPLFTKNNFNVTYLPIKEEITGMGSTHIPKDIIEQAIRRSSHRVIINRCTCRDDRKCENHPIDYGCTLLGEGTKEIDPRIARHVSVEESIDHLNKTINDGLIPMIGRVKIDNFIWGVKDRGKLLTICHCCRCCCTILNSGKYFPEEARRSLVPFEGVKFVTDNDKCTLCGKCVEECFMAAISVTDERIVRDYDNCKACGRCITVCPEDAITAEIDSVEKAVDELMGRVRGLVDFE